MPSSGYSAWSVIAGEQPTTAKWNLLGSNDSSFNSGSGFNDGVIVARHIAAGISLPDKTYNPIKFSAYRNGAFSAPVGTARVPFDTKLYDTGTNFDIATNVGRFTAGVAGFYDIKACVSGSFNTGKDYYISIYKNNTEFQRGQQLRTSTVSTVSLIATGEFQLALNDYLEVWFYNGDAGTNGLAVGNTPIVTYFSGSLKSAT